MSPVLLLLISGRLAAQKMPKLLLQLLMQLLLQPVINYRQTPLNPSTLDQLGLDKQQVEHVKQDYFIVHSFPTKRPQHLPLCNPSNLATDSFPSSLLLAI